MAGLPRTALENAAHRETLARLLDGGDRAVQTWEVVTSDFLSPPELWEAQQVFARFGEVHVLPWGGFPQAERQRLAIARRELPLDETMIPLTALDISGNFLFDPATHRDFLGALLGTGLERTKVGDILVNGDRGAQALVVPELAEYLTLHLNQVRSVPVKTRVMDLTALQVRPPQTKEMVTVEASLRLDAIASAGFGLSRSKMVEAIERGDVRVNWQEVTQPSYQLKTGDLVAFRGKGRLDIGEIALTKKERYRVLLTRLL